MPHPFGDSARNLPEAVFSALELVPAHVIWPAAARIGTIKEGYERSFPAGFDIDIAGVQSRAILP
jgi:hypothetical protein